MFTSYSIDLVGDVLAGTLSGASSATTNINTGLAASSGASAINSVYHGYDPFNYIPYSWDIYNFSFPTIKKDEYPDYPKCKHEVLNDGSNIISIASTGFSKKELDIQIENDCLVIRGKKEELADTNGNTKKNEPKVIHNSISQKNFEVAFKISDKFDTNKIETSYNDGLLVIKIPLSEEIQKKNRKIEIK